MGIHRHELISIPETTIAKLIPTVAPLQARMDSKPTPFRALTGGTRSIWAKSGTSEGHGLLTHMLDVAAVTEVLLSREPSSTHRWAARGFGLPLDGTIRWLSALVGLHDFGKATPGFQAKWPAGMVADEAQGLIFTATACKADRHDLSTASLLRQALHSLTDIDNGWLPDVIRAISAHHGHHFTRSMIRQNTPLGEHDSWSRVRGELLAAYWNTLSPDGAPSRQSLDLSAINWLAGLTSAADWIGSNPEWFPPGERSHADLSGYHAHALSLASDALDRIGWRTTRPLLNPTSNENTTNLLIRITGDPTITPHPLQRLGDALLQSAQGPSLLLVEAPMGEGKTELAFLAHLRLQAANGHRGLYVALPTQATSNAMHARGRRFLANFEMENADLQLVHDGAAFGSPTPGLQGINDSRAEGVSASSWFSQRRRPLLSHHGIGTIDQALFAALNVKHHFVRLWGLGNRVVVIDEVHAYDTYTSSLIEVLLEWLRALGCSVVVMSATLPAARRQALLEAWGVPRETIPDLPYPRVLLADRNGCRGEHTEARPLPAITLRGVGEDLSTIADLCLEQLNADGCGVVIVNTVDRAQTLYVALRERIGADVELLLFHARFPADERAQREEEVLARFGRTGDRPKRALLIATQVVEQSLDLDFDFMISDLAPVDLLLQRAGRLHRHPRDRPPAHTRACLWVAGLLPQAIPDLTGTKWKFVYDAYLLGRTWALLREVTTLELPGDIDRWVQAVYSNETPLPDSLGQAACDFIESQSYAEYIVKIRNQRRESTGIAISPGRELDNAYADKPEGHEEGDGVGLVNRTRTGPESITLIPVEETDSGWQIRMGTEAFPPEDTLEDGIAQALYRRQLKVSSPNIVRHFKSIAPHATFSNHPLLRHCRPLLLRNGQFIVGNTRMRLDPALGLVYQDITQDRKKSDENDIQSPR